MAEIIDITIPFHSSLATWPGDTPTEFSLKWKKSEGSSVNVGSFSTSLHSGTHADAPFHFDDKGMTIDHLNLGDFIGPAVVVDVTGRDLIRISDMSNVNLKDTQRILFKTCAWTNPLVFPERVPVLHEDVPYFLHEQGVTLVGFDVPSVDPLDSKELLIHHSLAQHRINILESLMLKDVEPGYYELIALPLNIVGADGSPVRAILRR